MEKDNKNTETKQCTIPSVSSRCLEFGNWLNTDCIRGRGLPMGNWINNERGKITTEEAYSYFCELNGY